MKAVPVQSLCRSQAELLDLKRCHEAAAQLSEAVTVEFCGFFYTERVNKMEMVRTKSHNYVYMHVYANGSKTVHAFLRFS